ncbi:MAG: DNA polymerase II [Candidatus Tectomicrobia bacterium]|uniref:DNA-directed DNA polymerase n=1 Tax=Tectimicrobiota bacterium TaxID=2528274 RepID=A0A932GQK3_UNCTE|nr:DNA polymerase II [Candidatus Tectomicrobia bacterium]
MVTVSPPGWGNPLLYGHDLTPGIVAVEMTPAGSISLYIRREGKVTRTEEPLEPFMFLSDDSLLKGFEGEVERKTLAGNAFYRELLTFPCWKDLEQCRKYIQTNAGITAGHPDSPQLFLNDPVQQYLIKSGKTSFKEMDFSRLKRLQVDIETYCAPEFEFPNAGRKSDRITAIALCDESGFERVLFGKEMTEEEMLREFVRLVRDLDPDVIEGHNLFKFDLPYLCTRARMHKVHLELGREGQEPTVRNSRLMIAERTIDYPRYGIYGRHVVDTWILAQYYDIATRELESFGLKDVAVQLGVAGPQRVYVEGDRTSWYFDHEPETLLKYALDDVREVRDISALLSPSYFLQAQIFPYSFQNVVVRGNAAKIDALFLREYLRQGYSIPKLKGGTEVAGGYTDIFWTGVVKNVLHCDVQSLYPSIMLAYGIFPECDELQIFSKLLKDLVRFRLEAKEQERLAKETGPRSYYHALQTTFKIVINSFYGYLGHAFSHFADFVQAAAVTEKGRVILRTMIGWLREQECEIVEIDTDGIYFVPPAAAWDESGAERLIADLNAALPEGIVVELDGRYAAMFSYTMKNYALLDLSGRLTIKGSGLRSRGIEKYQRDFLRELILLALRGELSRAPGLLEQRLRDIAEHKLPIKEIMKTETLQDSVETYQGKIKEGKRNRSALYELAQVSGRPYQAGDQVSYYVTGDSAKVTAYNNAKLAADWSPQHPDENVAYYQKKLRELYEKFVPALNPAGPQEDKSSS